MVARLKSVAFHGIEAVEVEVEVDVLDGGYGAPTVVGLPDAAVKESLERVRSAIQNSGYEFPRHKCVINLAPADLRKEGPAFDLAISLGVLMANGTLKATDSDSCLITGELALDGRIRPVRGVLSTALLAKQRKLLRVFVPHENAQEAAVVDDVSVYAVSTLTEAVGLLTGQLPKEPVRMDVQAAFAQAAVYEVDFSDVRGQENVKRALTIAAAGWHNVLLIGPPGSGKTMLAKRVPTIMPPLSLDESLQTTRIHSVAGALPSGVALFGTRPVRSPHHSASTPALVGGGSVPQAGEVSLAHNGVLFLDELPEFTRTALEALRQPLEDATVTIARAHGTVCFPASFMLIAAMNPCPCGYFTDPRRACKCAPVQIENYLSRISGPLIDRIDIHVEVPAVPFGELRAMRDGTPSSVMREQVQIARRRQAQRYTDDGMHVNGRITGKMIRRYCELDDAGEAVLRQAISELGLSARAHDKVLRLCRTIADLDGRDRIAADDVLEAVQYRRLDRQL